MNFLLYSTDFQHFIRTPKDLFVNHGNIISQKNDKIANMTSPFQNGQTGERVYSN